MKCPAYLIWRARTRARAAERTIDRVAKGKDTHFTPYMCNTNHQEGMWVGEPRSSLGVFKKKPSVKCVTNIFWKLKSLVIEKPLSVIVFHQGWKRWEERNSGNLYPFEPEERKRPTERAWPNERKRWNTGRGCQQKNAEDEWAMCYTLTGTKEVSPTDIPHSPLPPSP